MQSLKYLDMDGNFSEEKFSLEKDMMKTNKIKFKKRYGQNFLRNNSIINNIIDLLEFNENALVLEIGCGDGALTKELINRGYKVLGYEIDLDLKKYLDSIKSDKLSILYEDFLKRDIEKDIAKQKHEELYVLGNLPYYITTPIIKKILDTKIEPKKIILMVQKEVGDRILANPGTKEYNSLTIYLNYNFQIQKRLFVNRDNFIPKPNVDSVILEFKKHKQYNAENEELFYRLVKDSFVQKRKTLKNNLLNYDFKVVKDLLEKHGYKETVRAEEIPINLFVEISNALNKNG